LLCNRLISQSINPRCCQFFYWYPIDLKTVFLVWKSSP